MKRQTYTIIGALLLVTLVTISTAKAQSANQPFVANIPFSFSIGDKTLSACKYGVAIANPVSDQRILKLKNLETGETVMLQTHARNGKADAGAKLVFNRYGARYFLAQAWTAADSIGMEVAKSDEERAARKVLESTAQQTEAVALKRN